jgi:hypothetical protein
MTMGTHELDPVTDPRDPGDARDARDQPTTDPAHTTPAPMSPYARSVPPPASSPARRPGGEPGDTPTPADPVKIGSLTPCPGFVNFA